MDEISEFKSQLNYSDRKMWIADTIKHPAKAHLGMLKAIILEYSTEGDTILDPMAGIGSTLLLGMLHNRNVIGVEYEEKFCKTIRANIELNQKRQRLLPLGHAEIIRGDARLLSSMFKGGADSVVCSPPYSESLSKRRKGHAHIDSLKKTRQMTDTQDDNIANLPHGDIDSVIFSPPYEQTKKTMLNVDRYASEMEKRHTKDWSGGRDYHTPGRMRAIESMCSGYSSDEKNIGNLKAKTYLEAMKLVYSGCYTVLKPGGVAVIITKNFIRSKKVIPLDQHTLQLCESVGFTFIKRHYRKITRPSFWRALYKKKYGISIPHEDILVFRK